MLPAPDGQVPAPEAAGGSVARVYLLPNDGERQRADVQGGGHSSNGSGVSEITTPKTSSLIWPKPMVKRDGVKTIA